MSALVVTVAHKNALGKQRRQKSAELNAFLDKRLRTNAVVGGVGGEVQSEAAVGCYERLAGCLSLRFLSLRSSQRFARLESAAAATTAVASAASAGVAGVAGVAAASVGVASAAKASSAVAKNSNSLVARLVGKAKATEAVRLETALANVQTRMVTLQQRADDARKAAVAAKRAGKTAEALASLKKAKAVEKQLATVGAALAALEQQRDMLEETALHKELASTLASTNKSVKVKTKGLLGQAEKASDEAVELRDDVEDISNAFESLIPASSGPDDDELLDELDALVEEAAGVPVPAPKTAAATVEPPAPQVAQVVAEPVPKRVSFPDVPTDVPGMADAEAVGAVGAIS